MTRPARSSPEYNPQVFLMCVFFFWARMLCLAIRADPPTLSSARELLWCSRKLGTIARCCRARRQAFLLGGWLARAYASARSQGALGGAYHHDSPHPCLWSRPTKVYRFPSGRGKYAFRQTNYSRAHALNRFKITQSWHGS